MITNRMGSFWTVFSVLVALLMCTNLYAEEAAKAPVTPKSSEAQPYIKHWFVGFGGTNFRSPLNESEGKIDAQINGIFGKVLPNWQKPTTFGDWSKNTMLWDVNVVVGRDMSRRTSLALLVGGATGKIPNHDSYGPLATDIKFTRFTAFASLVGSFYPWGKPVFEPTSDGFGNKFKSAFRQSKPYVSLGMGYVYMDARADVRLKAPGLGLGQIFRQQDINKQNMFQISPRLGLELPVSENNSIILEGAYYKFHQHDDEYSAPAWSVGFRHRF